MKTATLVRWPMITAAVAVGAVALLHLRDPHQHGSWGLCPFYALTGWYCPGCGGLRGVNDLTNGHVAAAIHSNIFLLPIIAIGVWAWARWLVSALGGAPVRPTLAMNRQTATLLIIVATVFTVVRNTPWGHWLAPV